MQLDYALLYVALQLRGRPQPEASSTQVKRTLLHVTAHEYAAPHLQCKRWAASMIEYVELANTQPPGRVVKGVLVSSILEPALSRGMCLTCGILSTAARCHAHS